MSEPKDMQAEVWQVEVIVFIPVAKAPTDQDVVDYIGERFPDEFWTGRYKRYYDKEDKS